jgi:16S rRNA pseudouridine516 synthase
MNAESEVSKVYLVETLQPIPQEAVAAFAEGFHFATEDITTLPAGLEILAAKRARITLQEGRHHQIKRMLGRVGCLVSSLHRESIGSLTLPESLMPGRWRALTDCERLLCLS